MSRLIVWRHGRTEWNFTGRFQGQTDVDLDDIGVEQAEAAAPRLAAYRPDVIVSSDLRRAARTAEALAAVTGLPVELDKRLRERDFGPWQGLTQAQIRERFPEDLARWHAAEPIENPAIETIDDMAKRVCAALRDVVERDVVERDVAERVGVDGTAVVVTHGGAARAGCACLLGWPRAVWHTLGVLGNCHLTELRRTADRGWNLHAHNVL